MRTIISICSICVLLFAVSIVTADAQIRTKLPVIDTTRLVSFEGQCQIESKALQIGNPAQREKNMQPDTERGDAGSAKNPKVNNRSAGAAESSAQPQDPQKLPSFTLSQPRPNPITDRVTAFTITVGKPGWLEFKVVTEEGNLVVEDTRYLRYAGTYEQRLELDELSAGHYTCYIKYNGVGMVRELVVLG